MSARWRGPRTKMPPIMKPIQVSAIMTALSMGPFADFILSLSALAGLACNEVVTHTRSFSTATFGRLLLGAFGVEEVSKVKCSSSAWQRLAFIARGWPRLKARALEGGYLLGPCYTECWDLLWCVTAWPTAYFFLMLAVGLARAHRFRQGGCSWLRAAMMGVQTCPGVHIVHLASLQFVIRFPLNRLAAQFWPGCSGGIPLTPSTSYVMLEGPLGWVPYISGLFVIKVGKLL